MTPQVTHTRPADAQASRWMPLVGLLLLAAYAPIFGAGFIWDDPEYLLNNVNLRSLPGLWELWTNPRAGTHQFYPLTMTTFWLEWHLWGAHPLGYHVVNVVLHAVGAGLLWRVLTALEVPGAGLGAALFALHPVQLESVAWVTERKNVLSMVFYLGAALAFLSASGLSATATATARRPWLWVYALLVLGMLSKTVVVTFPAAAVLVLLWKRRRLTWPDVRPLLPLFAVGATLGLFSAHLERTYVGAQGVHFGLSAVERVLLAARVVLFYAGKLLLPAELCFSYPRWSIRASDPVGWLYLLGVIAVTVALAWRARRQRPALLVAWLGFMGSLFPALGFVDVYPFRFSFVADHFQYLATPWMLAALGAGLSALAPRWGHLPAGSILVTLAAVTWMQAHVYRNTRTLWTDVVEKNPSSVIGHVNLAQALSEEERWEEAQPLLQRAVLLAPHDRDVWTPLAVANHRLGRLQDADAAWREAWNLAPGHLATATGWAATLAEMGQRQRAADLLDGVLAVDPNNPRARALRTALGP